MGKRANIDDYAGKEYGILTIVGAAIDLRVYGQFTVHCICDCGNEIDVRLDALKSGNTKSCGCLQRESRRTSGTKNAIDLTGMVFGRLTVVSKYGPSNGGLMWNCICECGNTCVVRGYKLRTGHTCSCGCLRSEAAKSKLMDLSGKRFGRWTVLRKSGGPDSWRSSSTKWLCRCDCGTEREVYSTDLRAGSSTSCGCFRISIANKRKINETRRRIKSEDWSGFAFETNPAYLRRSLIYKQWRDSVLDRDCWSCQKCKEQATHPKVHHINSFADFPDQRLDINNGITLCTKCHIEFHHIYGTHHNTRNQFDKWMSG